MCIAVSADAGDLAQLTLERDKVGDHFDGLDRRGVPVGLAGELVQVAADASDLPGALGSTSAAAAVHVRVRAIACRSRSDSGTPAAAAFARLPACRHRSIRMRRAGPGSGSVRSVPRPQAGLRPQERPPPGRSAGHLQGRNAVEDPRSGLTRRATGWFRLCRQIRRLRPQPITLVVVGRVAYDEAQAIRRT